MFCFVFSFYICCTNVITETYLTVFILKVFLSSYVIIVLHCIAATDYCISLTRWILVEASRNYLLTNYSVTRINIIWKHKGIIRQSVIFVLVCLMCLLFFKGHNLIKNLKLETKKKTFVNIVLCEKYVNCVLYLYIIVIIISTVQIWKLKE